MHKLKSSQKDKVKQFMQWTQTSEKVSRPKNLVYRFLSNVNVRCFIRILDRLLKLNLFQFVDFMFSFVFFL